LNPRAYLKFTIIGSAIKNIVALIGLLISQTVCASDTLNVTIEEAQKLFFEKNLLILAERYNIELAQASILSAKIYDNPNLHFEVGAYNSDTRKVFDMSENGQQLININQMISVAGKRNKRLKLAKINKEIAQNQFYDLIRTLNYTLKTTFVDLYYDIESLYFYQKEIDIIEATIKLYEAQYNKGNISLKEIVRLKSLVFQLQSERLEIVRQVHDEQELMNVLMQTDQNTFILPSLTTSKIDTIKLENIKIAELFEKSRSGRFDLKIYQNKSDYAQKDLEYQRSIGIPNPTLGLTMDRQSNYIKNYIGPVLDIPIPIFNRNQGNTFIAKIQVDVANQQLKYFEKVSQEEVISAYVKLLETDKIFKKIDQRFLIDFENLIEGVISNFEKRNIGLVEFIDLYEAYKDNTILKLNLQNNRFRGIEELNYATGSEIIKW
jgi:outer membrane protein, heavy metal efflux system